MAESLPSCCLSSKGYLRIVQIHKEHHTYRQLLHRYIYNLDNYVILYCFLPQNHRAERHWVEINSRINYPIKRALINMQQLNLLDMDCPVNKFCVSMMVGKLCQVGIQTHLAAWNNHHIPGMLYICMHAFRMSM